RRVGRERTSSLYEVQTSGEPIAESPAMRVSPRESHRESLMVRLSERDGGSPGASTPSPGASTPSPGASTPSPGAGQELPTELPKEPETPRPPARVRARGAPDRYGGAACAAPCRTAGRTRRVAANRALPTASSAARIGT